MLLLLLLLRSCDVAAGEVSDDDECVTTKVNDFQLYKQIHRQPEPQPLSQPQQKRLEFQLIKLAKLSSIVARTGYGPTGPPAN